MKPLTIKLPHPSTNARQPLPLGLLVPSSGDPSLLVVMPTSGKITYWESLTAAATADPTRQKQQCIQATVNGMMSGEVITRVCEGEPHGFVLTFGSGRIAHIAISDLQGKPSIVVRFLRNDAAHSGGLFGGLRSVFSTASWRRDVAAVHPGISLHRGHKQLVVATTKSVFQIWDLNWNGTQSLIHEIDGKESFLKALAEGGDVFHDHYDHHFEVLDFAFKPKELAINENSTVAKAPDKGNCELYALTVLHGPERSMYNLMGLTLVNGSITVDVVHPISCYRSPLPKDPKFKPQIIVPEPGHTAFIIFEKSIVLVSLEKVPENADTQVLAEADEFPGPFQDSVEMNKNKAYRSITCAAEPADTESASASCVVSVHGFGMVRFLALSTPKVTSARDRARVTARTKIEQAVFFGNAPQDLLDFSGRSEVKFSHEQIETAAKEISDSILKNSTLYLPRSMPSMEKQLQRRASALADLMKHLKQRYEPLSRSTRWHLLWEAEKVAAAIAMWRTYQVAVKSHPNGKELSERNLLAEAIEICSDKLKNENQPERYETDGVRHWFVNDVWRLERLLPYIQDTPEQIQNEAADLDEEIGYADRVRLLGESVDLELAVYETAFQFREANAFLYGVGDELMVDGVLHHGYEDLEAIWTSDRPMLPRIKKQTEQIVRAVEEGQEIIDDTTPDSVVAVVNKLQTDLSRHIQILSQSWIEEFQWLEAQSDPGMIRKGQAHRQEYFSTRKAFLVKLAEFELFKDATRLAEKYEDMEALVEIKDAERLRVLSQMQEAVGPGKDFWKGGLKELDRQIKSYFSKYGKHWSDAFFTKRLASNETAFVLEQSASYQQALTAFLRRKPQYAKIGWINEVCNEQNFSAAADDLQRAQDHDTNLWQKRIEVSMRKLALLAASQQTQIKEEDAKASIESSDKVAATINMQDQLQTYFEPTLKSAIDADAGADLLIETHFIGLIQKQKYLYERTRRAVQRLVNNEVLSAEDLIDIFTLMNGVIDEDGYVHENKTFDNRFNLALYVLRCSDFYKTQPARHSLLEKIIWRRCIIYDDWEAINRTEDKDDATVKAETEQTAYYKTLKGGFANGIFHPSLYSPKTSFSHATHQQLS